MNTKFFSPISSQSLACLSEKEVLIKSPLTMNQTESEKVLAIFAKKYLYIQTECGERFEAEVNFFTKFEIIFENQSDIKSTKIGFKLFQEQSQSESYFYCEDQRVLARWLIVLKNNLSQYGFHQQFKPIRRLGKGQFATVFEVECLETGLRFAVKAFSKANLSKTSNAVESLINEIKIMRSFSHKNLQKLESVFESANSIYVVTELLKGGTLFERIQNLFNENLTSKMNHIRQFISGLLDGLSKLKELRIVHRDLKLDNIMLRNQRDFDPVIIDFGLGTFSDDENYLFYRCGTPGYVSPEVMASTKTKKIEPESDMFSAGAILHYLLTEKPLFEGRSADEVLLKNKNFIMNMLDEKYNQFDQEAMILLKRMLEIDHKKRISVSEALINDFLNTQIKNDSPVSTVAADHDHSILNFFNV